MERSTVHSEIAKEVYVSNSSTDRTRHHRRRLFPALVSAVCLSGCVAHSVAGFTPEREESPFEQYEVITGSATRQTVLTGFLLGGDVSELAVVNVDANDNRRLHLYAFGDGIWLPNLDATLGSDVLFVDVANIAGRDRLVTYEPGRLNWFDPESATEHALVAVTSNFDLPWCTTRDLGQ